MDDFALATGKKDESLYEVGELPAN
jgi:hypothetical protein